MGRGPGTRARLRLSRRHRKRHQLYSPEFFRAKLLAKRVTENLRRWAADEPLLGMVDVAAGY